MDRFWVKVKKGGPDECWPWKAGRFKNGYGAFRIGKKIRKAHVVAFELKKGRAVRTGKEICHSCDNKPCCNVRHMFEGTRKQNMQDCVRKGRSLKGDRNPNAKLTRGQVIQIRKDVASGATQSQIARLYGVSPTCINLIVHKVRRAVD